jgi:hypothetical protein
MKSHPNGAQIFGYLVVAVALEDLVTRSPRLFGVYHCVRRLGAEIEQMSVGIHGTFGQRVMVAISRNRVIAVKSGFGGERPGQPFIGIGGGEAPPQTSPRASDGRSTARSRGAWHLSAPL